LQNSTNDRILSVNQSRGVQLFSPLSSNNKYVLQPAISGGDQIKLSVPFAHDIIMNPKLFATSKDGKYLFTCGHWDNSFKLSSIDSMKVIRSIIAHDDVVTCLALSEDGKVLVTGSRDTTVNSWDIDFGSGSSSNYNPNTFSSSNYSITIPKKPSNIFYGHDSDITTVAVNREYDLLISGSKDGTCIIHSLRSGSYVRTLKLSSSSSSNTTSTFAASSSVSPSPSSTLSPIQVSVSEIGTSALNSTNTAVSIPTHIFITTEGNFLIAADRAGEQELHLYSINGKRLKRAILKQKIEHMIVTKDDKFIVTASQGSISVLMMHTLKGVGEIKVSQQSQGQAGGNVTINCLVMQPDGTNLFAGLSNGKMLLVTDQPQGASVNTPAPNPISLMNNTSNNGSIGNSPSNSNLPSASLSGFSSPLPPPVMNTSSTSQSALGEVRSPYINRPPTPPAPSVQPNRPNQNLS